jgi:hypothetical protein
VVGCKGHAPVALPPGKRPGTHCTGDWVGGAGLEGCGKSRLHRGSNPGSSTAYICMCRSWWQSGLRRGSAADLLLGLRVRILPGAWMSVPRKCRVLSLRRVDPLFPRNPTNCVWSRNLKNEAALARVGLLRQRKQKKKIYIYICVCVCVFVWCACMQAFNCVYSYVFM